jgi:hypothetical protein
MTKEGSENKNEQDGWTRSERGGGNEGMVRRKKVRGRGIETDRADDEQEKEEHRIKSRGARRRTKKGGVDREGKP